MVPGLTFITQDLMGKKVNWHQILIYKENELTPSQRYRQRQEEKRQEFVAARNEEIQANLLHMTPNELEGQNIYDKFKFKKEVSRIGC